MSAKKLYHDAVVQALIADGWTITHDPLTLSYGGKDLFVDIGAERVCVAAERGTQRIAVEVQSFLKPSPVRDLEEAIGQFALYRLLLAEKEPERLLYLAVSRQTYSSVFAEQFGQFVVKGLALRLVIFDVKQRKVVQWID